MKILFVIFALVFTFQAHADLPCEGNFEAQFIAQVASVRQTDAQMAIITLNKISHFQPNQLCPLDPADLLSAEIKVPAASYKVNDHASGVLIYINKENSFRIN